MIKLNVYTTKGTKTSPVDFPKAWQEKENKVLLAQAIRIYEARRHLGLSKVKTRGEVKASTKKIYRQKGTGRARHGAVSAPIFVGGGKAHGPKGVKRVLTLPKKMRQKALKVALTMKAKKGQIFLVSDVLKLKKTKEAAALISKISKKEKIGKGVKFTFGLAEKNLEAQLALRNIKNVLVVPFKNLNAYNVFLGGILFIDKEAISKGIKSITPKSSSLLPRPTSSRRRSESTGQASKKSKSAESVKKSA